jgi:hypothetical protein
MLHAVEDTPPEPKIHVMHDFESWALKSTKPCLISLGGVKFTGTEIIDSFHVRIDPADCQRFGLEIEAETVKWWMHNDRQAARDQLDTMGEVDLYAALDGYAMWVRQTPADQLGSAWSNGSNFDNARLKEIYRILGLDWPFSYKQEECYRTMKNRFPEVPCVRVGVHHGALDDAQTQAVHLQTICRSHLIAL